jgi:hypothetical protein
MTFLTRFRMLLLLCCVCAAALAGAACSGGDDATAEEAPAEPAATAGDAAPSPSTAPTPADEPAQVSPADTGAEEVAMGFLEAYGALDADRAIGYLADGADISRLIGSVGSAPVGEGTLENFRLLLTLHEAEDYKQTLRGCEDMGSSEAGTSLRCNFDFHEFGQGPFSGSYFEFTVRDGKIVEASKTYEIGEYSPQVWEPFYAWVATHYPQDLEIMYTGGGTGVRLTEESIRLWDRHRREYVEEPQASG